MTAKRWRIGTSGCLAWQVVYDNGKAPPTYLLKAPDGSVIEILPAARGERIEL